MKQVYHSNATTNIHIRYEIQKSNLPVNIMAEKYNVYENTISKWKNRDELYDRSCTPHTIYYALVDTEQEIIQSVRKSSWLPLDEIVEVAQQLNPSASRSAVYRTLLSAGLNKVPEKEREKAKKFKEYEPGYLHIDVTYLPKIEGVKHYLFVAIDRATRTLFYQVYDAKTSENTEHFVLQCKEFFPFKITHILTDNGLEFTNALYSYQKKEMRVLNPLNWMSFVKQKISLIALPNQALLKQMVWWKEPMVSLNQTLFLKRNILQKKI